MTRGNQVRHDAEGLSEARPCCSASHAAPALLPPVPAAARNRPRSCVEAQPEANAKRKGRADAPAAQGAVRPARLTVLAAVCKTRTPRVLLTSVPAGVASTARTCALTCRLPLPQGRQGTCRKGCQESGSCQRRCCRRGQKVATCPSAAAAVNAPADALCVRAVNAERIVLACRSARGMHQRMWLAAPWLPLRALARVRWLFFTSTQAAPASAPRLGHEPRASQADASLQRAPRQVYSRDSVLDILTTDDKQGASWLFPELPATTSDGAADITKPAPRLVGARSRYAHRAAPCAPLRMPANVFGLTIPHRSHKHAQQASMDGLEATHDDAAAARGWGPQQLHRLNSYLLGDDADGGSYAKALGGESGARCCIQLHPC